MLPQVFVSAFIFVLPAVASESFPEVHGIGGDPVTLPCSYPATRVLSFVCWGRGACASDTCGQKLVWTDGNRIHYRTSSRYQINAQLLQGNASLTIEDACESDSGLYCCRVEMKGWDGVQTLTTTLQVQPGSNSTRTKGLAIGISIFLLLLVLVSTLVITTYVSCQCLEECEHIPSTEMISNNLEKLNDLGCEPLYYILMKKRPGSPSLVSLCVSKIRTLLNKEAA